MSTFRRPIDNAESLRSTRRSLGDGTVTGRSRLAMPPANRARGTGFQRLTGPPGVSGVSTGETITVAATSVAISTTPTLVSFTQEVGERAGFFFTAPSVDIQPTFGDAYYDIQVSIDRGGYGGTVAVEVLRGDTVVWGPTFDPYWNNPTHPVSAKGRLVDPAISPWRVRLTGDGSGTLARVTVQVELVDRPRLTPDVIPEPTGSRLGYGVRNSSISGGVSASVTPGLLDDVEIGDVLLFVAYFSATTPGTPGTWVPPSAGLSLLHMWPLGTPISSRANQAGVWWRRATQDDLDGVNVYTSQVSGGTNVSRTGIAVMPLFGLGLVGNPFSTVNDAYSASAPANLSVAAPGSPRTLVVSWAVRNTTTVPGSGNYEQTPQTTGLDSRYFWINPSDPAPTTGQFFGFDGDIGSSGGSRRGGMFRVLTADANSGAQIKYGESLTHHGLIAVGIDA